MAIAGFKDVTRMYSSGDHLKALDLETGVLVLKRLLLQEDQYG